MSFCVFFDLSVGLSEPIQVPKGTLDRILDHVRSVETVLGYETEQYLENPRHWKNTKPADIVTDEIFCEAAEEHNRFVRWLYDAIGEWQKTPPAESETITIEDARQFWHGLRIIEVPAHRWTGDYYRARMEALYEAMRGREGEGILFDEKPLTPKQAAQVIILFSGFLDSDDLRLDVPKDCDHLASSSDGGYIWCERCGAVTESRATGCRKRKCPVRDEFDA